MRQDTTQPAPRRIAVAAALAASALLAGMSIEGCRPGKAAVARNVRVLRWRRDLRPGAVVERADFTVATVPPDEVAAMADLAGEDKLGEIPGRIVRREVRRGALVRLGDLGSADAATDPAWVDPSDRWHDLPVAGDPTTMEADGDIVRYASPTKVADSAGIEDYTDPRDRPIGPGDLIGRPLGDVGLDKITGPVPGEAAPDGAQRTYAFRQYVVGGEVDHLGYYAAGAIGPLEEFYTKHLAAGGYRLARRTDKPHGRDGVSLTFYKDAEHQCFVTLRPADTIQDAGGEGVKIILILRHPAGEAAR